MEENMKDRIRQIMETKKMTQQEFAQFIEISPASLSSIFTGRSNPTNNHVFAIHKKFPEIRVDWLMFGEGEMYSGGHQMDNNNSGISSRPSHEMGDLFSPNLDSEEENLGGGASFVHNPSGTTSSHGTQQQNATTPQAEVVEVVKYIDKPVRKIVEIRVFFDDGTYELLSPPKESRI